MTATTTNDLAELHIGDQHYEFPLVTGSEGERAIDIRKLRSTTGLITLDPGFGNTGSCKSTITFIDGEQGILRYRGYPIEELAATSSFLPVSHLLLRGELPSPEELEEFTAEIKNHTMLHENFKRFFGSLPATGHPMAVLATAVGALSTFYPDEQASGGLDKAVIRLLAKMPTLAAYSYKHSLGQPFNYPHNDLDYCSNFLHMMFATPCEDYVVDPVVAKAIDLLLILHADHEQNCSTSTVRLVGSSHTNLFASISAGISALWGPLHGGANQRVIEMLHDIAEREGSAKKFVERAKDRDDTSRLMGFGHRVYKNYDPRAKILKQTCREVTESLGTSGQLLDIALELEEIALEDDFFVQRKLYPNVDFYSGVIYEAIGIPIDMFTVMFTMGRLPGWIAQWMEMREDPDFRIGRPRQIYTGSQLR